MTHRGTAWAQIALSMMFIGAYFGVLLVFLFGYVKVPADWKDVFATLLSVLTAGVLSILSYWFQRQRSSTDSEQK
jgi:uncharacterized membrane protein YbhN (UPF0104 family)